jgi:hypothetical protein
VLRTSLPGPCAELNVAPDVESPCEGQRFTFSDFVIVELVMGETHRDPTRVRNTEKRTVRRSWAARRGRAHLGVRLLRRQVRYPGAHEVQHHAVLRDPLPVKLRQLGQKHIVLPSISEHAGFQDSDLALELWMMLVRIHGRATQRHRAQ